MNAEAFVEQPVLSFDLVVIVVFGKPHPEPVGRLGRAPVADRVRQDDEVLGSVERLAGAEQPPGEFLRQQPVAGAAGAVQNDARARRSACRPSYTEYGVRQDLPAMKFEIVRDPFAVVRHRGSARPGRNRQSGERQRERRRPRLRIDDLHMHLLSRLAPSLPIKHRTSAENTGMPRRRRPEELLRLTP